MSSPEHGLSLIEGKEVIARCDGGWLSSCRADGGLLVLLEIEQRLKVAERLVACMSSSAPSASPGDNQDYALQPRLHLQPPGLAAGTTAFA